jgi:hypothetical protein
MCDPMACISWCSLPGHFLTGLHYTYCPNAEYGRYTRYWCKLHTVNSEQDGLLRLCQLFEQLLQTHQPHLFLHLQALGCEPLDVACKWMVTGFGDVLRPQEVLLLWDRVIGFDSLEVVAIMAAAVFSFRRAALMQATTAKLATKIVSDVVELQVVPLLQFCLFINPDGTPVL